MQFSAKITPAEADQRVTWFSSNPKVASVSASGLVTAVSEGVATITAISVSDPSKKISAAVQVVKTENGKQPATPSTIFRPGSP